jgi:hypothetical protein
MVWDDEAVKLWTVSDPRILAGQDRIAAQLLQRMKELCPVSPVQAVYAYPVPEGYSLGPVHRGRPIARPGGAPRTRLRYPGDLPLPASGTLRNSIVAVRDPEGAILVGPTASYARYVIEGTPPHVIRSTGPWPLRNRATGQVFGPVVQHPGTQAQPFVTEAAESMGTQRMDLG